jgi:hypothetical protein
LEHQLGENPDINENSILRMNPELISILLKDRSSGKNILWMTNNYASHGAGYEENSEITIPSITGKNHNIIKPRISKSKLEQFHRIRDKAEVFTPSWICNKQNNLIDNAWFGRSNIFNIEDDNGWSVTTVPIPFATEGEKTWRNYVLAPRLEVSCGEAPYLVSRYDTTTGKMIHVKQRIGLLDRKLRVVSENTTRRDIWLLWSMKAVQSIYGYEWQGDNLLLARENIVFTYIDYYKARFDGQLPPLSILTEVAEIVSWNLWQMDGLKFVIPCSCHENVTIEMELFGERVTKTACEGCTSGDIHKHNGIYCKIKDWQKNETFSALSMLRR